MSGASSRLIRDKMIYVLMYMYVCIFVHLHHLQYQPQVVGKFHVITFTIIVETYEMLLHEASFVCDTLSSLVCFRKNDIFIYSKTSLCTLVLT